MLHQTLGYFILVSLCLWTVTHAEVFEECGQRKDVYVASSQSCSKYIYCDGEESSMGDCEADTPYFSETDQTCDTEQSVCKENGKTDGESSSSSTTSDGQTSTTTAASSTSTDSTTTTNAADPSSSTTTSDSTSTVSSTTTGSTSSVSTTEAASSSESSTTSESTTSVSSTPLYTTTPFTVSSSGSTASTSSIIPTSTAATNVAAQCPETDDPAKLVFLPHATSCSDYYMCYHGDPMPMHCSNMLHFDPKSQKCDYPENVKCQLDSGSPRDKCQVHTVDVYPYPNNCNYYYVCQFGYLMVMQCPLNMDWDYEKKACRVRGNAMCYHSTEDVVTM